MNQPPKQEQSPAPQVTPPQPGQVVWGSRPAWGTFRTGLLLIIAGLTLVFLVLAGSLLMAFATFNAVRAGNVGNVGDTMTLMLGFSLCSGLGGVWILTGLFLTPSVPGQSGASGWGFLSLLGLIGALGLSVVLASDNIRRGGELLGGFPFGGLQGNPAPLAPELQPRMNVVVQAGQPMNPDTLLYLGYAFLGCIALTKLAFTLTIFQVARFLRSTGLAVSIGLYLFLFILVYGIVVLGFLGKLPIMQDDPLSRARFLSLLGGAGGLVLGLWMLINLMVVRGTLTNKLLERVPGV